MSDILLSTWIDHTKPDLAGDVFAPGALESLCAVNPEADPTGTYYRTVYLNGDHSIPYGVFGRIERAREYTPGVWNYLIKPTDINPRVEEIVEHIKSKQEPRPGLALEYRVVERERVYHRSWWQTALKRVGLEGASTAALLNAFLVSLILSAAIGFISPLGGLLFVAGCLVCVGSLLELVRVPVRTTMLIKRIEPVSYSVVPRSNCERGIYPFWIRQGHSVHSQGEKICDY